VFSAYVHETIGNLGILKLMRGIEDRTALFRSSVAYCDRMTCPITFSGTVSGDISKEEKGKAGWGYDPIFCPRGSAGKTYAQMGPAKDDISHRRKALEKFARWFRHRQ